MRDGERTIRVEAVADVPSRAAGAHRLHFENRQPESSMYPVNALEPATDGLVISSQQRDVQQRRIDLDFEVTAP